MWPWMWKGTLVLGAGGGGDESALHSCYWSPRFLVLLVTSIGTVRNIRVLVYFAYYIALQECIVQTSCENCNNRWH